MMPRLSTKYNDSCIKIFEFLKLLYTSNATYKNVITIIETGDNFEKVSAPVLLNKYLNTLKVFGINVKKIDQKYIMINSPYKIDFDEIDLKSIALLKKTLDIIPKSSISTALETFLSLLFLRFSDDAKNYFKNINVKHYQDLTFYYTKFEDKINFCEKICKEKQKIEIEYKIKNAENMMIGLPIELKYQRNKIYLMVQNSGIIHDIPIEKIKNIKQLPNKICYNNIITVVFKLKNRLAKAYKLKDEEYIETIESDGSIVVVNKGEDLDKLLARLMKYQNECEVISPKIFKEKMVKTIETTLKQYEN